MTAVLRAKSQVTIPKRILRNLKPEEGQHFNIIEIEGGIFFQPVAVYPKEVIERWEKLEAETDALIDAGKLKSYKSVDEWLEDLEANDAV